MANNTTSKQKSVRAEIIESVKSNIVYWNATINNVNLGYNKTYKHFFLTQNNYSDDIVIILEGGISNVIATLSEMVKMVKKEYNGGRIDKYALNTKYGKVGTVVDIKNKNKRKIWDCFIFDCDDCVKGNCEGCPLNIEEAN